MHACIELFAKTKNSIKILFKKIISYFILKTILFPCNQRVRVTIIIMSPQPKQKKTQKITRALNEALREKSINSHLPALCLGTNNWYVMMVDREKCKRLGKPLPRSYLTCLCSSSKKLSTPSSTLTRDNPNTYRCIFFVAKIIFHPDLEFVPVWGLFSVEWNLS